MTESQWSQLIQVALHTAEIDDTTSIVAAESALKASGLAYSRLEVLQLANELNSRR